MSGEKQETTADIVAEMRIKAERAKPYDDGIVMMLTVLADRLEAACKREKAEAEAAALAAGGIVEAARHTPCGTPTTAKSSAKSASEVCEPDIKSPAVECPPSNVAAMRKALKEIRARLVYLYGRTDGTFDPPALKEVCGIADEALASDVRCAAATLTACVTYTGGKA